MAPKNTLRQKVLVLYLKNSALDSPVARLGASTTGPAETLHMAGDADEPPYATGLAALKDGWRLFQASQLLPHPRGEEFDLAYLKYEFFFEQLVEVDAMTEPILLTSAADGELRRARLPALRRRRPGRHQRPVHGRGRRRSPSRRRAARSAGCYGETAGRQPHPRGPGRHAARRGLSAGQRRRAAAGPAAGARRAAEPAGRGAGVRPPLPARHLPAALPRGGAQRERLPAHPPGLRPSTRVRRPSTCS